MNHDGSIKWFCFMSTGMPSFCQYTRLVLVPFSTFWNLFFTSVTLIVGTSSAELHYLLCSGIWYLISWLFYTSPLFLLTMDSPHKFSAQKPPFILFSNCKCLFVPSSVTKTLEIRPTIVPIYHHAYNASGYGFQKLKSLRKRLKL